MSVQTCSRDQYKIKQVIDQIKILADNVDELRTEISALKSSSSVNGENTSQKNRGDLFKGIKNNVVSQLKRYMTKVTKIKLRRKRQDSIDNQEVLSYLSYIFGIGKKETWKDPSEFKGMKSEYSQTDETASSERLIGSCILKSPRSSKYINSTENIERYDIPFIKYRECKRYDKLIFPGKRLTLIPQSSEISCDLDLQIENSLPFTPTSKSNKLPGSWIIEQKPRVKTVPQKVEVCLSDKDDKQFESTSTQTKVPKIKQRCTCHHSYSKQPSVHFSKIRNAVITKKLVRHPNGTFIVCGRINHIKDYPYLKKQFYEDYLDNKSGRKKSSEGINFKICEKRCLSYKNIMKLKSTPSANNDGPLRDFRSEENQESCSSISVDLEVNVSKNSNKINEVSERKRPRTYVVNKASHDQDNWLDQYEKSVIYVGQMSALTLSSGSFPNSSIVYQ